MKALSLISGGLDSLLAARLILDQGIAVTGVGFSSPFYGSRRGRRAAESLGIPFVSREITGEMIEVLSHPAHGYGRHFKL